MAGRAKKKCLFEDDVRAMLGMPKVSPPSLPFRVCLSPFSAPTHAARLPGRRRELLRECAILRHSVLYAAAEGVMRRRGRLQTRHAARDR